MLFNRKPLRCLPMGKWIGIAMAVLGAVLLIICIPLKFWGIVLGLVLILVGTVLIKL